MIFPVQTSSSIRIEDHFPGWCSFQVNGSGRVVFPADGYFYMTRPTAPIGFISGDTRENILIFIPNNIRSLVRHPFWDTPIPNFYAFRFRSPNPSFEVMVENILSRTQSENNMSVIEASTITIGHEDRRMLRSSMVSYRISTPGERMATTSAFTDAWGEGDYLVIPVSEGQEIWEFSNSFTFDFLIGRVHGRVVGSPFEEYTYYFDTQNFLRRMFSGGRITDVPSSLGWTKENSMSAFVRTLTGGGNEVLPFKITRLPERYGSNQMSSSYVEIVGGYQHIALTVPYRENGSGEIHPEIMALFNDSYAEGEYSGTYGTEDPVDIKIRSNTAREIRLSPRTMSSGSLNSITPIATSANADIRFSQLGIDQFDGRATIGLSVGTHRFIMYFEEDIFKIAEEKLVEIANNKIELLDQLNEPLDDISPGLVRSNLLSLGNLIEPFLTENRTLRSRYINQLNYDIFEDTRNTIINLDSLVDSLGRVSFKNPRFAYLNVFFTNEKRISLVVSLSMVIKDVPNGKENIRHFTRNIFNENTSPDNGINIECLSTIVSNISTSTSVLSSFFDFMASSILDDLSHQIGRHPIYDPNGFLISRNIHRLEQRYSNTLRQFNLEIAINSSYNPDLPTTNSNGPFTIRSMANTIPSIISFISILADSINCIIGLYNIRNSLRNNDNLEYFLNLTTLVGNLGSLSINTLNYYVNTTQASTLRSLSENSQNALRRLTRPSDVGSASSGRLPYTSFAQAFAFITTITDNINTIRESIDNSHDPQVVRMLAGRSIMSWSFFLIGLGITGPIGGISMALVSFLVFYLINDEIETRRGAVIIYPPPIEFFIAGSFFGKRNFSRIRGISGSMIEIGHREWFTNINKQISIAYSYLNPINNMGIQLSNTSRRDGVSDDGPFFAITFQYRIQSELVYIAIDIYSSDNQLGGEDNFVKIRVENNSFVLVPVNHEGDSRLFFVNGRFAVQGSNRVHLNFEYNIFNLDPTAFNKYRITATFGNPEEYYSIGANGQLSIDQLQNYPYTVRAEFPMPSFED